MAALRKLSTTLLALRGLCPPPFAHLCHLLERFKGAFETMLKRKDSISKLILLLRLFNESPSADAPGQILIV